MRTVNEITKFLSNLTYQEKQLPTNLCESVDLGLEEVDAFFLEVLVTKDSHYFVLEIQTKEQSWWSGIEDEDYNGYNTVFDSVNYAYKYNFDGERIATLDLSDKQSDEIMDLLPSITDIN